MTLSAIIARLRSPHADKVFVAEGYTKADLIRDLKKAMAAAYLSAADKLDLSAAHFLKATVNSDVPREVAEMIVTAMEDVANAIRRAETTEGEVT